MRVKDRKYRDPAEFLQRDAKDRYVIPSYDNYKPPSYNDAIGEIHRDFLLRKYNL